MNWTPQFPKSAAMVFFLQGQSFQSRLFRRPARAQQPIALGAMGLLGAEQRGNLGTKMGGKNISMLSGILGTRPLSQPMQLAPSASQALGNIIMLWSLVG